MKRSAGILPYKIEEGKVKVYLEHPGGPYAIGKDEWSICKGEYKSEGALAAALREFYEESGHKILANELIYLGGHKQKNKKVLNIFIVNKDLDTTNIVSNTFKKEWPPGSGQIKEFSEMDQAEWFDLAVAYQKIYQGQKYFLRKLERYLEEKN